MPAAYPDDDRPARPAVETRVDRHWRTALRQLKAVAESPSPGAEAA